MTDKSDDKGRSGGTWSVDNGVLMALLAAMPVVMASGFTTYESLKTGVLLLGGGLLALIWAVRVAQGRVGTLRGAMVMVPLAALVALAAISALWAPNVWRALQDSAHWGVMLAVIATALADGDRRLSLVQATTAVAVGTGLASIVSLLGSFGVVIDTEAPTSAIDGLRGSFDSGRYAAVSLVGAVPMLAAGAVIAKGPSRIVIGVSLALTALAVGASGEPMAWVMGGGGVLLALLVVLVGRGGGGLKVAAPALGALVAASALVAVGGLALQKPDEVRMALVDGELKESKSKNFKNLTDDPSLRFAVSEGDWGRATPPEDWSQQTYAMGTGLRSVENSPLGVGAGNWDAMQTRDIDRGDNYYRTYVGPYPAFRMVHNSALQTAAELGILGVLFLLITLALIFAVAIRTLKSASPSSGEKVWFVGFFGLVASLCVWVVGLGVAEPLELATSSLFFALVVGLLVREGLARLAEEGSGKVFDLDGMKVGERMALAVVPAALVGLLALWMGASWTMSDFYKARGDVWLRAGNLDDAKKAYEDAIGVMPANDLALLNVGNMSEIVHKSQAEREAYLLKTLTLRPHDPRLFNALGVIQMREAGRRGRDKLKEEVPKPGEKMPDPQEMNPMDMMDFVDSELMKRAIFNLNHARELHPRYIPVYENLSNAYMIQKQGEKARIELLKGIEQLGEDEVKLKGRLYYTVGQSYLSEQAWAGAKKNLIKAIEIDPNHTRRTAIQRDLGIIEARIKGVAPDPHGHAHPHGGGKTLPKSPKDIPRPPLKGDPHKGEPHKGEPHKGEPHKGEKHKGDGHEGHKEGGAEKAAPK